MKLCIAALMVLVAGAAHADGSLPDYDQAIVTKLSLDPNEAIVNDDGVREDPQAPMSGTARAFRNGVLQGRSMQKEADDHASPPPLPPAPRAPKSVAEDDHSTYTAIPPQPHYPSVAIAPVLVHHNDEYPTLVDNTRDYQTQRDYELSERERLMLHDEKMMQTAAMAIMRNNPEIRQAMDARGYDNAPQPQPYILPQPQNYQEPPQAYVPPPGPPASTYVVIHGVPPTLATGYWPAGYTPRYPPVRRYVYDYPQN